MKTKILTGWNFGRVLFLIIGLGFIFSSIQEFDWIGFFAGLYFLIMGLLGLGCAGGSCGL